MCQNQDQAWSAQESLEATPAIVTVVEQPATERQSNQGRSSQEPSRATPGSHQRQIEEPMETRDTESQSEEQAARLNDPEEPVMDPPRTLRSRSTLNKPFKYQDPNFTQ